MGASSSSYSHPTCGTHTTCTTDNFHIFATSNPELPWPLTYISKSLHLVYIYTWKSNKTSQSQPIQNRAPNNGPQPHLGFPISGNGNLLHSSTPPPSYFSFTPNNPHSTPPPPHPTPPWTFAFSTPLLEHSSFSSYMDPSLAWFQITPCQGSFLEPQLPPLCTPYIPWPALLCSKHQPPSAILYRPCFFIGCLSPLEWKLHK